MSNSRISGEDQPDGDLRSLMAAHRLRVGEVAAASGVSSSSVVRLRSRQSAGLSESTVRRIAAGVSDLAQLDPDEVYLGLLGSLGRDGARRQGDFGLRGSAELVRHYQRMNATGRRIILEQAKLLARVLPDSES
jgi:hypothetical protein